MITRADDCSRSRELRNVYSSATTGDAGRITQGGQIGDDSGAAVGAEQGINRILEAGAIQVKRGTIGHGDGLGPVGGISADIGQRPCAGYRGGAKAVGDIAQNGHGYIAAAIHIHTDWGIEGERVTAAD